MGQPLETHIRKLQEFYWSERDPDGRGFVPLADALRKAGDFVESNRVLREGLGRHPDFVSGYVVAGWLSLDRGKPEEAEARFKTALELDPRNVAALRAIGDILIERGDGSAALEVLEALAHEDPIDPSLPGRIADLRNRTGSAPAAIPDEDGEPAPPIWDDPHTVADELDWESATLQPDESPEEGGETKGDDPGGKEFRVHGGPVPLVEDGEPIPGDEGLQGAVITSTLGEIFLRQGLFDQAEEVFETLLEADTGNLHLQQRLNEVRSLKSGGESPVDWGRPFPFGEEDDLDFETPREALPEGDPFPDEPTPFGVVPIESLAPDRRIPRKAEGRSSSLPSDSDEPISIADLAPDEPISIVDLAPDEPISIADLAPDEPISIADLAPDEPLPIQDLAPDGPSVGPTTGAFGRRAE